MKILLLLIMINLFDKTNQASCTADNMCMACNSSTANQCDTCFNWGSGSKLARSLNTAVTPTSCSTVLGLTVARCKYYKGDTNYAATSRAVDTCWECQTGLLHWKNATSSASCVVDTPIDCVHQDNCSTTICYESTSAITSACRLCNKNYSGAGWESVNNSGSDSCTKTNVIFNCESVFMTSSATWNCYACKKNFAVTNSKLTCITYTSDPNCREQDSTNTACYSCWHSYYWDTNICKQKSRQNEISYILVIGLFLIVTKMALD